MRSTPGNARRGFAVLLVALLLLAPLACTPKEAFPPERGPGQPASSKFLYAELLGESTSLWIAPADRPGEKKEIARIPHQTGYGIRASLSPDGGTVAYTALPAGMPAPDQASLWALTLSSPSPRLLAEAVDLPSAPVWSRDSKALAYRRSTELSSGETEIALYVLSMTENRTARVVADSGALGLYPFAWSEDGHALYFFRVSKGGTDVAGIEVATSAPRFSYHVTDGIGRDFQLSPDGKKILYSSTESAPPGAIYSVSIVDLADGSRSLLKQGAGANLGAIWKPDGKGLTLASEQTDPIGGGGLVDVLTTDRQQSRVVSPPAQGFDVPLAWSPNAAYLAASHYAGKPELPGARTVVILSMADGRRSGIQVAGDAQFIGWVGGG
ncbi:MAG: PD40 domain-containing protein [Chloroflexi bacterium]|nr:PD40 domain-containing protein [Chloroflexota bacterium]